MTLFVVLLVAVAVADSGADAGAVAQAMVVGGSSMAGALLGKTHRVEAILVVRGAGGRVDVLVSASLQERFRPSTALASDAASPPRFLLPPASL